MAEVNPRKCDVWALGLLCWEVHRGGQHYFQDPSIKELLSRADPQAYIPNDGGEGPSSLDQESAKVLSQKLLNISHQLVAAAENWVDQALSWTQFDRAILKGVFRNTLKASPSKRLENIARLPLIQSTR